MPSTTRRIATSDAAVHYRVEATDLHAHLFRVVLTVEQPSAGQTVSMPVWIPGSYLIREFSRHLQKLTAVQAGQPVALDQLDKCSWKVACAADLPLVLEYEIYAFDNSVRACWLGDRRGFFNGTGLCLCVDGQEERRHTLELVATNSIADWYVATALEAEKVDKKGFGQYGAASYHALVDSPVEMGAFWSGDFVAAGVPHRFVIAGAAPTFDGERLIADAQRICEAQMRFWHPDGSAPPHDRYVFMLNAVDEGYGGLEHRHSTALICNRRDLPRVGDKRASEGYTTLLGLISHEYFHTWNVKRLRPAEFAEYDYAAENYTQLLWFFEGFTSYYDDVLLRRAGLLDDAGYLRLLNKTINQVLQAPGRLVQSVAQASFDAWVKYYRQDENTANATISYYTKGALVALCFDLTLRLEGKTTLDEVMRAVWQRCSAGPMREADFVEALQMLGGRSFASEMATWVHGTDDLPLETLLEQHGAEMLADPSQPAQRLGMRVTESGSIIQVKVILRGGAAEGAGFAVGDEWIGVSLPGSTSGWRINKLDDLALYLGSAKTAVALVARDRKLLSLPLELPENDTTCRLTIKTPAHVEKWLDGSTAASS